jgi:hypothetical protein
VAGDEEEAAAGAQGAVDRGHQARLVLLEDVAEGAEARHQVEFLVEGERERVGAQQLERGAGGVGEPLAGRVEHALAEVHAHHALAGQGAQEAQGGAGAAAHVERAVDRGLRVGERGLVDDVRGAEGGVVELGGEQVIALLDGGERLAGELEEGGAFGVEHGAAPVGRGTLAGHRPEVGAESTEVDALRRRGGGR